MDYISKPSLKTKTRCLSLKPKKFPGRRVSHRFVLPSDTYLCFRPRGFGWELCADLLYVVECPGFSVMLSEALAVGASVFLFFLIDGAHSWFDCTDVDQWALLGRLALYLGPAIGLNLLSGWNG